jgi:hypothetical protein
MAVNDPGRRSAMGQAGAGFAARRLARPHHQRVVDRLPQPLVPPAVEKPLNRRKRLGQQPPLTARGQQIQQGIDHNTQHGDARSPQLLGRRQQGFDLGPFGIDHIACIAQTRAAILRLSGFSPHLAMVSSFCN